MSQQSEQSIDTTLCFRLLGIDLDTESCDSLPNSEPEVPKKRIRKNNGNKIQPMTRTDHLAKPNYRRLLPWPDPELVGHPVISRAALYGPISSRLEYLSRPRRDYYDDYTTPNCYPKLPSDSSRNSDKSFGMSDRLIELSKPRLEIPEERIEKSCFKSRKHWKDYQEKLKTFAAARRTPPEPLEPKRKKAPLESILPRLEELAKPLQRPSNDNERTYEELNTINSAVLKYVASDRIRKLAVPKTLNEETLLNFNYDPRKRLINAKRYVASERIKELAKPIIRDTPEINDEKPDAFKVNPKALKARCTPRLKRLARPVVRQ